MSANFISNAFLCGLIAWLFAIAIFVIIITFRNSYIYRKWFSKSHISILVDLLLGVIVSLFDFVIFYLSRSNEHGDLIISITASLFIVMVLPASTYCSPYVPLGGFITFIIGIFVIFNSTLWINIYLIVEYLSYLLSVFVFYYVLRSKNKFVKTALAQAMFLLLDLVISSLMIYVHNPSPEIYFIPSEVWFTTIMVQVLVMISVLIISYVNSIYIKTQKMTHDVRYENTYFIAHPYAIDALDDFISSNNVQYGYMIGFAIRGMEDVHGNLNYRTTENIKTSVAEDVHRLLANENTIFFKNNDGGLFAFVPTDDRIVQNLKVSYENNRRIKRSELDPLSIFNGIQKKISPIQIKGEQFTPKIAMMVTVYGIHANDVRQLIQCCEAMVRNYEVGNQDNSIQLFNSNIEDNWTDDLNDYFQLKHLIDTTRVEINFSMWECDDKVIFIPRYSYQRELIFSKDGIIKMVPMHLRVIMLRHLSMKAIQSFAMLKNKHLHYLLIKYPIETLKSDQFSIMKFYQKLKVFDLSPKQIWVNIDLDYLPNDNKSVINNIRKLKETGIQCVVVNATLDNIEFVRDIKPVVAFPKVLRDDDSKLVKEYNDAMHKLLSRVKVKYIH